MRAAVKDYLDDVLSRILNPTVNIIAAHLRLTDQTTRYQLPKFEWYHDWITECIAAHPNSIVYIASDDLSTCRNVFTSFSFYDSRELGIESENAWLLDFYVLCLADFLAVSQSGFSINAAILNLKCNEFVYPCFQTAKLRAFLPSAISLNTLLFNPGI